ncbi:MAG: GTPase Era [Cytophagaceae bacterium]|nr:GTPase Era [Cytophagaceae bacterium]
MENKAHKAGFVSIVGKPNVGKSTLMNVLVGERLSIITSKAQTTRHRIMGIVNGEDFQIVYSDTPGIIEPKYELQKSMMRFVSFSLEDADLILFVTDIHEKFEDEHVVSRIKQTDIPVAVVINKVDLAKQEEINEKIKFWKEKLNPKEIIPVSALEKFNTDKIFELIIQSLPMHPPYFDKDALTDRSERFFASEIIREKIFLNYDKEIPYSTEVVITDFKETKDLISVRAEIYVERDSQKGIIIGKKGEMLKKIGTESRKEMEAFFGRKVFLEQYVKVEPDWRKKENKLKRFGYNQ